MGYKIGWILSGVIIVLVCVALVKLLMFPSEPDPTGEVKWEDLKFKKPSIEISEILGSEPSGDGNAADDYVKALKIYSENKDKVNEMAEAFDNGNKTGLSADELKLCEEIRTHVRAGARKKEMKYILEHTPKILKPTVPGDVEFIGVSNAMLNCLFRHNYNVNDFENCKTIAGEALTMGWHLMKERSRGMVLMIGAIIQRDAVQFMGSAVAKQENHELSGLCSRYEGEMSTLIENANQKMKVLRSANPEPGDVFMIVRGDEDRTWKVEGLYSLLFLRYRKRNNRGTIRAIDSLLSSYRGDSDPIIAAAVESVLSNDIPDDKFVEWWMNN